jgi:hypothetical protein
MPGQEVVGPTHPETFGRHRKIRLDVLLWIPRQVAHRVSERKRDLILSTPHPCENPSMTPP